MEITGHLAAAPHALQLILERTHDTALMMLELYVHSCHLCGWIEEVSALVWVWCSVLLPSCGVNRPVGWSLQGGARYNLKHCRALAAVSFGTVMPGAASEKGTATCTPSIPRAKQKTSVYNTFNGGSTAAQRRVVIRIFSIEIFIVLISRAAGRYWVWAPAVATQQRCS